MYVIEEANYNYCSCSIRKAMEAGKVYRGSKNGRLVEITDVDYSRLHFNELEEIAETRAALSDKRAAELGLCFEYWDAVKVCDNEPAIGCHQRTREIKYESSTDVRKK